MLNHVTQSFQKHSSNAKAKYRTMTTVDPNPKAAPQSPIQKKSKKSSKLQKEKSQRKAEKAAAAANQNEKMEMSKFIISTLISEITGNKFAETHQSDTGKQKVKKDRKIKPEERKRVSNLGQGSKLASTDYHAQTTDNFLPWQEFLKTNRSKYYANATKKNKKTDTDSTSPNNTSTTPPAANQLTDLNMLTQEVNA